MLLSLFDARIFDANASGSNDSSRNTDRSSGVSVCRYFHECLASNEKKYNSVVRKHLKYVFNHGTDLKHTHNKIWMDIICREYVRVIMSIWIEFVIVHVCWKNNRKNAFRTSKRLERKPTQDERFSSSNISWRDWVIYIFWEIFLFTSSLSTRTVGLDFFDHPIWNSKAQLEKKKTLFGNRPTYHLMWYCVLPPPIKIRKNRTMYYKFKFQMTRFIAIQRGENTTTLMMMCLVRRVADRNI